MAAGILADCRPCPPLSPTDSVPVPPLPTSHPRWGCRLSGPVTKREPVRRIVTPLRARALVLDNRRQRIAFVVCDCASIYYSKTADKGKRLVRSGPACRPSGS